ncbi:MAG: hypothetical protein ABI411_04745 [Tahibacter sp.]
MRARISWCVLSLLLGYSCAMPLAAQPAPVSVPPLLDAWRGWVLKDLEYRACPFIATSDLTEEDNFFCAWPGRLQIDASARGAELAQSWRVEATSWIPLPGDAENWPQQVTVDGQAAPVLDHDDGPMLRLSVGTHRIVAHIPWQQRPQQLSVPKKIGLIDLRVDGKTVSPLQRSEDQLTLGRGEATEPEADAIEMQVFRKLTDEVPALLETRIHLSVSGQAREESVGPVLPLGFVPIALSGGVPARLDGEGKLHIQAQPGAWDLVLLARLDGPLGKVTARLAPEPWPNQEIWSFAAVPRLRVASLSGEFPIDPAQAGLPNEWRNLPAFTLADAGQLSVEERTRGLSQDANRLQLVREAWLDFGGAGLYAKDRIVGQMHRDWRLDVAAPYVLERADSGGEGLLITRGANAELSGVEVHNTNVNISAGVRIAQRSGVLPVNGWQQTFDNVSLQLHLPYGWRLLAAPGADNAAGSWISRWNLLDVFLVAIVVLLAGRFLGFAGGAMALAYLVLGYHEFGAPLWSWFGVLLLALLLRNLPAGKLQTVTRWAARSVAALLLILALPFFVREARYALYPQLENTSIVSSSPGAALANYAGLYRHRSAEPVPSDEFQQQAAGGAQELNEVPPMPASAPAPMVQAEEKSDTVEVNGSRIRRVDLDAANSLSPASKSVAQAAGKMNNSNNMLKRYAQNTVIQSGRGEPGWQYGSTAQLHWSGPVAADQSVRLLVAAPWLVRILRVLMLGALVGALGLLLSRLFGAVALRPVKATAGFASLLLIAGAALFGTSATRAEGIPDSATLEQLRERLTEAPRCSPDCANLARAQVRAQGDEVSVSLEVHAGERVAIPLPGEESALDLTAISMDGAAQDALVRRSEQLWLAVSRGVHRVEMSFRVTDADHVALKFPMVPARVETALNGWQGSGISEDRLLGDTLTLARERRDATSSTRPGVQQFPPYVQLVRTLVLDLEWRVESTAQRVAPIEGGFAVNLPLLPGEQVLSSGVKVSEGSVALSFGAGQSESQWSSRLERSDAISLTAPALADRGEIWKIVLSPTWHAEFSGIPEVQSGDTGEYWTHEFHPLPGETLKIVLSRPEPVSGRTLAIDNVSVQSNTGLRAVDTTLNLNVRSTQGGEHALTLPPAAEVLSVSRNGQALNLRPRDGHLSLPLSPGPQNFQIALREERALGLRAPTAALNLNSPAANVQLGLNLPEDRWVLFATGPAVGPAVLYWGELLVMIGFAFALARTRRTPLRAWHWLLLGLGFSTASWFALLLVAAWLLLLDWRARRVGEWTPANFNVVQIAIALASVVALCCIVSAVYSGLLSDPDMGVRGNGSTAHALRWFADQSEALLPVASVWSLPLWVHKIAMLAWALWMAVALADWLRWGYAAWSKGGYWRPLKPPVPTADQAPILDVDAAP